ncbi:hypothetical protein IAU60_000905 [Kwoniella sp. DSM 27419]
MDKVSTSPAASDLDQLPVQTLHGEDNRVTSGHDDEKNEYDPSDSQGDLGHKFELAPAIDIPWKYRIPAFAMILLFGTGATFCDVTIGPLKSTLRRELKITNTQFSTVNTAMNIVNTVLPMLGGLTMDYVGGVRAAMVFSCFIVIGSVVAALSANTGKIGLLIGGRILMGFGSAVVETCQYKLYTHWFTGSKLATVIAIDLAWISVISVCARLAAVPMSLLNGWYGWALWIPCVLTVLSAMAVIGYYYLEKSLPVEYRPGNGATVRGKVGLKGWKFAMGQMTSLPMFFWMLCGTEIFQNAARTVYSANLADIQEKTRGTATLAAGYNASLQNVVSIILSPLVGLFMDRFGWRMFFVSFSAALYIVVFALVGLTTVNPTGPIVLSSIALGTNVMPFIATIPVLVPNEDLMGTAYGIWSSFIACNNIILEIATGAIQDKTPGKTYDRVIYFLIAIKAFQVCLGPIYDYLDGRLLGHSLRMNESKRLALRKERLANGQPFRGWLPDKKWLRVFGTQFVLMVLCSWVLYLTYTVGIRK